MQTLDQFNFKDKKALVRVDFNVPLNDELEITDDTRIKAAIPTIKKILSDGGSVILMSHLGRPKSGDKERFSLQPLVPALSERLSTPVKFADDCVGENAAEVAAQLQAGGVLLLNNLRFYAEETKGDLAFAKKLAQYGQVYVNDAFGTAHRAHASTTQVAQFFKDKVCGYVMQAEIENAQKVLNHPSRPFTAIMGGAKVSDKMLIIEQLLDKVDCLMIGGGMSYTFSKANGGQIGDSICEHDKLTLTQKLVEKAKAKGVKLLLPVDTVIANAFQPDAKTQVVAAGHIPDHWQGLDIGHKTIQRFTEAIESAKTVLWNGPMGVFEFPAFAKGTNAIAQSVAKATQQGSFSLIGGGDSAAAINQLGYANQVSYVSTGGGALLEYMEGKTLPGIAALE